MKLSIKLLLLGLAVDSSLASIWSSKAAYNKWQETELERWLSDHGVPYPTPYDRKQLTDLVKNNWQAKIAQPYNEWEAPQISAYLKEKGWQAQEGVENTKESLVELVKTTWVDTTEKADDAYSSVRDWIFDSWSDSQLKAFADYHGIPVPQPNKRDTLLAKIRSSYETVAQKAGETISYPGDWLYSSWSDSDLKAFLDARGIPAPQTSTRDKLIASVRRNSRLASLQVAAAQSSASSAAAAASASASGAIESMSEKILESWNDVQIREWASKNGVNIPEGANRKEILAIARKHRDKIASTGENVASSVASAFGAATSSAGNAYAQATDDVTLKAQAAFDSAIGSWSDSRLKAYLDERGVPVPQNGKRDELLASVRLNKHKAATGWSAWTFDTWTVDNLKSYLATYGDAKAKAVAEQAGATRDDLIAAAQDSYNSASTAGGAAYASVTSYLAQATDSAKDSAFDTWSDSELKSYLDSYGVPVPQGSTTNELKAWARNQRSWFKYGTTSPQGIVWAKVQETAQWVLDKLSLGAAAGRDKAAYHGEKAAHRVQEQAIHATNRAKEEL